ncbi:chemotaxis protein CheW [Corallococcus sp. AB049A]|uniref:Chemotaxis protein CheW n=1 Tax=Corallococcus interemptor TaxID=2316720 RepID=A0A3A8R3Y2_9BACT|nr:MULTISPECIES: chemotaxis protein CheW [Corallococcus]RKH44563.1 chemotaxis protein CheW [Corallococcus sp. AB050B]RKH73525.1 chemotaxis protein CheW [Corallococcus interemptor]RKI54426.1 chemotaxis protein CheW [Corallococcus sp. AB049A]
MPKREGNIDWDKVRARLEALERATEARDTLTDEAAREALDARARALARPADLPVLPGSQREVVRFKAAGQTYALESRFILEVLRAPELTLLPGAPPLLRGLTLLRGEVLPVVELAPLFGRPAAQDVGPVLVVGTARAELGLRTDEVMEVAVLTGTELLPAPPSLEEAAGALVSGVSPDGTLVLEGEALLADERLVFELSEEGVA